MATTIQSKAAAARGARKPEPGDGDDVAVRVANLERELAEARAKLAEREKDAETWRAKAEATDAKYTAEKIRGALRGAAAKANAIDPEDVVELVINRGARIDGDRVVFGQGAEAKAADEFVASFVASKPHLMRAAQVAQGSGTPSKDAQSAPATPQDNPRPKMGDDPKKIAAYYADEAKRIRDSAGAPKK